MGKLIFQYVKKCYYFAYLDFIAFPPIIQALGKTVDIIQVGLKAKKGTHLHTQKNKRRQLQKLKKKIGGTKKHPIIYNNHYYIHYYTNPYMLLYIHI